MLLHEVEIRTRVVAIRKERKEASTVSNHQSCSYLEGVALAHGAGGVPEARHVHRVRVEATAVDALSTCITAARFGGSQWPLSF